MQDRRNHPSSFSSRKTSRTFITSAKPIARDGQEGPIDGETFRWARRTKEWSDGWRNLHHRPAVIPSEFALDEGPSRLYDALSAILGLDALVDAQAVEPDHAALTQGGRRMSDLAERFEEYVSALSEEGEALQEITETELQLALVLILVQVLRADMEIRDDELDAVIGAVQDVLGRGRDEATELMRVAAHSARDSERTRRALERLDRHLTHGQRLRLLEWLWRIAFADAEIVAQEEYLIRKISEILGLSTADVIEAKVRAKESFG